MNKGGSEREVTSKTRGGEGLTSERNIGLDNNGYLKVFKNSWTEAALAFSAVIFFSFHFLPNYRILTSHSLSTVLRN